MDEGADRDDKYRMVEDEFLSIAKKWTVHLHTAEYHRQKRMARNKNAEAINSISRPVTQRMPEQTRKKLDSINLSKTQRSMLLGLLGKKDGGAEESDGEEADDLPYIGTSLHGLMDSPRKRAASLVKLGSITSGTRAAAGFQNPVQRSSQRSRHSTSPQPRSAMAMASAKAPGSGSVTESTDDEDDDLDGPITVPKLSNPDSDPPLMEEKATSISSARLSARSHVPVIQASKTHVVGQPTSRIASESLPPHRQPITVVRSRNPFEETDIAASDKMSKVRKRLAQARLLRASKEDKEQKKLDSVPTFL